MVAAYGSVTGEGEVSSSLRGGELSPGIKEAPRRHPEDLNQIDLEAADKVGRSMAYGQR